MVNRVFLFDGSANNQGARINGGSGCDEPVPKACTIWKIVLKKWVGRAAPAYPTYAVCNQLYFFPDLIG